MVTIRIRLGDIHPSDLPRQDSWSERETKIPSIPQHSELVHLKDFGIGLIKVGDIYTVQNGTHRLARLIELLGLDFVAEAEVTHPAHYKEHEWVYQLQRVEREGVRTFTDFLHKARRGNFLR